MKGSQSSDRDAPPANFTREIQKRTKENLKKKQTEESLNELTMRLNKLKKPLNHQPISKESSIEELQERLTKLKMRNSQFNNGDTIEELQKRLDNLKQGKEKKPPAIRVMSYRKRKSDNGTATDEVTYAKRMIRQYTADDLINDVIKEVEQEKEEQNESDDLLEARFNDQFAGMDDESSRLIKRMLEEQRLEEMAGPSNISPHSTPSISSSSSIVTSSDDDDY